MSEFLTCPIPESFKTFTSSRASKRALSRALTYPSSPSLSDGSDESDGKNQLRKLSKKSYNKNINRKNGVSSSLLSLAR